MSGPAGGGVFISYRRQESSGITGRLYDRLAARFGDAQVFMDVDTIALGVDFTQVIAQAVSNCTVLLAVIGPGWLAATDEDGQRRLDDPDDIVSLEIQTALERDIRVIPILVEGAVMPRRQQLPEELAGLARRNAHVLRHESFRPDADRLLEAIEPILASPGASPAASDPAQVVPVTADPAKVTSGRQTMPGGSSTQRARAKNLQPTSKQVAESLEAAAQYGLQATSDERVRGKVKWYDKDKGYGFIKGDSGREYFVYHSFIVLQVDRDLLAGQQVTFIAAEGRRGPSAVAVLRVPDMPELS